MPISRATFNTGESSDSLIARMRNYLKNNSDKAFTSNELVDALRDPNALEAYGTKSLFEVQCSIAITTLINENTIIMKNVNTNDGPKYYYIYNDIGRLVP